jgi:hypothetical protein
MRFEWDESKNRANGRKHDGVDFDLASRVFSDESVLIEPDRVVDGEERLHAIGRVSQLVLLVVHVVREEQYTHVQTSPQKPHPIPKEETIRIIPARAANKREVRRYFQQTPH